MTTIPVDKEFLDDLIDFKLKALKEEVNKILERWDYKSSNLFLQHAMDGTINEAEEDAIILKNLQDQILDLTNKKQE
ncbi:MAG: hypothetical protein JW891_18525 [Candidatus Lokiarchaeota archaeon]|nr:hypothetical protein [Candidatus Lokiarchaeota archaeon]